MTRPIAHTEQLFRGIGGKFLTPATEIADRLCRIKALVLDWDGVFNSGEKTSTTGSGFSEIDSMGLNLLRFAFFVRDGRLPVTLIISGEKNESAFHYCEREGLTYSFFKVAHKIHALDHLCRSENLKPEEVAFFFDDVLDVPIAEKSGVRIQINQRSNPLFLEYCERSRLADYVTGSHGGGFAVREGAEMLTGLLGIYDEVISGRVRNTQAYQQYITARRAVKTRFCTLRDQHIEECERP